MAILNTNGVYLTLGGVDVASKFTSVEIKRSADGVDVTHGAATDRQRNAGIKDTQWKITLTYEISTVSTYIQKLEPGTTEPADYGPEGSTAGKPRQTQSVLITDVNGPNTSTDKKHVTFEVTADGADAPTANMFAGGTF